MAKIKLTPTKFKVGDWVTYPFNPERAHARVIELRGPLAPGGEQVYRLRRVFDWGEVQEIELIESTLEPSDPPAHQPETCPNGLVVAMKAEYRGSMIGVRPW